MRISTIFQGQTKLFYFYIAALGIINSVIFSSILVFINNKVSGNPLPFFSEYEGVIFILILAVSIILSKVFQTYIIRLTNEITYGMEVTVLEKLRLFSFQSFEKFGSQRIYTIISDTRTLSQVPELTVNLLNSAIVTICGLVYLFWVSIEGAVGVLLLMVALLILYLLRNKSIAKDLNSLRDLQDNYYKYLRDFIDGFKEIKMSHHRKERLLYDFLVRNREESKDLNVKTSVKYLDNELMGTYSWYLVLGSIMFIFSVYLELQLHEITSFIVTVLYLMGPVAVLVSFFPLYTRVKIAIERISLLENDFNEGEKEKVTNGNTDALVLKEKFHTLVFKDVVFEYFDLHLNKEFTLGPLNLKISNGELIFLTGGNGSGKSTFINILVGLYKPTSGRIFLNGQELLSDDYALFREKISAIFTSSHLFSENYDGFDLAQSNKALSEYLHLMKMEEVFKTQNSYFENKLSKGQQKRLGMIFALLEDKEILVLDEWAAEQDPGFRKYFYTEILPKILEKGKTILVVTHDDHYFKCAQRLIEFKYGRIVKDSSHSMIKEETQSFLSNG